MAKKNVKKKTKKKTGKIAAGKGARKGATARKGRPAGKKAEAKPKKAKQPRAAPARARGQVHFICSECYEEFNLQAAQMKDTITCPECLHVGKKPKEDFLRTVNLHKDREKKILVLATVASLLLLVAAISSILLLSPYGDFTLRKLLTDPETAMYVVGGGFGLFFVLGLILAIQYERQRWEVYF